MRIAFLAALILLAACDKPKSMSRSAGRAKGSFSESCANPVIITNRAGETNLPKGMAEVKGSWELESLITHFELARDGKPGTITMEYKNNAAAIRCHNSSPAKDSSIESVFTVPQIMNADDKTILAELAIKGSARNGVTSQEVKVAKVTKPLPSQENTTGPDIESQLVKTQAGKLILRLNMRSKDDSGQATLLATEVTYKLQKK